MKSTLTNRILVIIVLLVISFTGDTAEIRSSSGIPKIGEKYQNLINLDGRRKLILPDGVWEVNNVFDDKEANWHAPWKVITLINEDSSAPFRMTVVRYFSVSVAKWPTEACEKKSNQFAFGQDTTGSKGSKSICSSFFDWANPQQLMLADLPRLFNFHWTKALSKLPDEFIKKLPGNMTMVEITSSKNNGLYIRQEILIDGNAIGGNLNKVAFSNGSVVDLDKSSIQKWRIAYAQAMSRSYLDSEPFAPEFYLFKSFSKTELAAAPINDVRKVPSEVASSNAAEQSAQQFEQKLAIERKNVEKERALVEEQRQLFEQKQRLEDEKKKIELENLHRQKEIAAEKQRLDEEKKQAELEALKRQKELFAIQEERRQLEQKQLEKLQEDKLRQEKLAAAQAEAKARIEAEQARKEQERLLAEEAKRREELERKEVAERRRAAELAKAEEEKRRKEADALALAEKKKQLEEERKAAAEAKKAEDEERKKLEAYKKSAPTIEVTQSEPDEFGVVILDIKVTKPTKSLTINGESEGASKEGSYRVKRVLKKTGKTTFIFAAFDEFGNKGHHTLVAEHKSSGAPAAMDGMAAQSTARQERKAQIEKLEFDDCSQDFPYYLSHAASSLKKKNSKVSSKMSAILAAFTARDEGKSAQKIRDGYLCNQVSFAPNQEYPDGAYSILFREKTSITNNNSPSPLTNSFHFFAFGGIKGVQSYLERKTPICFEVVHYDERSKLFNSGFVVVELVNNIGFPKSVDSCNTLTEFAKPSKNLVEAIQSSISSEGDLSPDTSVAVSANDSSVRDAAGKKSKRPAQEDVIKNAYDHVIEKRWSIGENVSCAKDSYRIYSPKLPLGKLFVTPGNTDFLQRAQHSISNITRKKFDIESKIFTDGNLGMLALVKYDPNVIVSESKQTVELLSSNSLKITSEERMIDLDELMKSGKVTYLPSKKSVSISKLCEESGEGGEENGLPSETLKKIEDGKLWRQDLANRSRIKSLFACGEEGLPKKIALDRVTNIMTFMSDNLPAGAFQDVLRSHGCIRFTDPLPMKWLFGAKQVKRAGERTYYVIESDTNFAFGGYF